EQAAELNGEAPGILARACGQADCLLVHLSTDFVFDGANNRPYREDDTPNPLSVYGRTKLAGEEAVRREGKDWLIVRTGWIFGHQGRDFVRTMLRLANEKDELNVVDDQTGCPTYSVDIGRGIMKLIEAKARGTFHLVNSGQTTWFGLANKAISIANINGVTVNPITSQELGRPAQRPVYSVLDTARFESTTKSNLRSWEEALNAFIKKLNY
ncbi:MAG: dTDP-4-dehydrorhamnose reductase, partial [Deltaproteobacteria bacterium]|nr:dTDP-4-dehydrorhamnose reductase [Deltaproteobacteria bacterium]